MLNKKEIEDLEKDLLARKENFDKQLGKIAKKDQEIKDNYRTSFPNYGREDQDNAAEVSAYESTLPLEGRLEIELRKINIALNKIKRGKKYGICETCGKEIEEERLKAYPQASKCITCAKKNNIG
jgi:RNA polymerase-binding transcription factor DksA